MLNINRESNIPTFFSSMQLAFAAFVLWVIAETARSAGARFGAHWLALAVIFAYLALDESVSVHETIGDVMRAKLVLPGILYYAWYIPYGFLLVLFAVVYWRFFWHLPAAVRARFACAGAVFIIGAAGLEVVGSARIAISAAEAPLRLGSEQPQPPFSPHGVLRLSGPVDGRLLGRGRVLGREQALHFQLGCEPVLDLTSGHEAAALGAKVRRI